MTNPITTPIASVIVGRKVAAGVLAGRLGQRAAVNRLKHSESVEEGRLQYPHRGLAETPFLSQHGEGLMDELRHVANCVPTRSRRTMNGAGGPAALKIELAVRDAEKAE